MSAKHLDPLDLYDIRSELSEDEIMVKDTVGRFVDDRVVPLMREAFEQHIFPQQLIGEVAALGLLGTHGDESKDLRGTLSSVPKTAGITVEKASEASSACSMGPIEPSSR